MASPPCAVATARTIDKPRPAPPASRDYLGWTHVLDNDADLDLTQNQRNQAAQRRMQADQTVTARLLQTFTWALVPAQPDPSAPFVIRETKVEGQSSDALAHGVSRRLGNDGDLSTQQAAAAIRLAIDSKVPQIWQDGHVALGALWGLYSQYPYMPRLRDRRVLDEGVVDLPMIWQTDAFALATGYDEQADRYLGLWIPGDKHAAPATPTRSCWCTLASLSRSVTVRNLARQKTLLGPQKWMPGSISSRTPTILAFITGSSRPASMVSRRSTPRRSRWTSRTLLMKSSLLFEVTRRPTSRYESRSKQLMTPASRRTRCGRSPRTPEL